MAKGRVSKLKSGWRTRAYAKGYDVGPTWPIEESVANAVRLLEEAKSQCRLTTQRIEIADYELRRTHA